MKSKKGYWGNSEETGYFILGMIVMSIAMTIIVVISIPQIYKDAYSEGVYDTLNKYSCTEKQPTEIINEDSKEIVLCDGDYCIKCFSSDGYSCENYYLHPDYSKVKCACCGEFCSQMQCNISYGTYKINSPNC